MCRIEVTVDSGACPALLGTTPGRHPAGHGTGRRAGSAPVQDANASTAC
jgi:hypothetical protein